MRLARGQAGGSWQRNCTIWLAGWQRALAEAERQINQYKQKIFELKNSVKIIQDKIAAGEPWPE